MIRRVPRLKPSKQFSEVLHVRSQSDALPILATEDCLVIVKRGTPRLLLMRCPCGCGDNITLNLDPRAGRSWSVRETDGVVTLSPSIWRGSRCKSHFFLWDNAVYNCPRWTSAPARELSEEELLQLLFD
jgi:hypothetical protein